MFFFNKTSSWTGWSSLLPTTLVTQTQLRRGTKQTKIFRYRKHPQCPLENQQRQKTEGIRVMWILFAPSIYNSKVWKTWKDIFLVQLFPSILVPCNWTSHVGVCRNARLQCVYLIYIHFLRKGTHFESSRHPLIFQCFGRAQIMCLIHRYLKHPTISQSS